MPKLRAAAGKIDLEPRVGGWMTGFASRVVPAQGVHDPILARAVVMDNGESSAVIVACDLLGFSTESVAWMRSEIERCSGVPSGGIIIGCTHTHSGPTSLPMRGVLGYLDQTWLALAQRRIVDLVSGLSSQLKPATLRYASTTVTGVGFNRQDRSRPHDEELVVISVESEFGCVATIANYATHAVVLGGNYVLYSADFPGEVNRQIEERRGGVSLYLQGACGDINPAIELRGDFADCERIGSVIAQAAVEAVKHAPGTSGVSIEHASAFAKVPLDPPPSPEQLAKQIARFEADRLAAVENGDRVKEMIAAAMLDWAEELRVMIGRKAVPDTIPAEVFALKVNDLRLVGLPFETYNDIGVLIKSGLKPYQGAFVGYANGLFGYCPTRWAKEQGGYGPEGSVPWFGALLTPIGYGADELLIREGIALANSL